MEKLLRDLLKTWEVEIIKHMLAVKSSGEDKYIILEKIRTMKSLSTQLRFVVNN